MVRVRIDFSDGNYSLMPVANCEDGVWVSPEFWTKYLTHCAESRFWHEIIRHMDNAHILESKQA